MKIYVIAGEPSGDSLGSAVLPMLQDQDDELYFEDLNSKNLFTSEDRTIKILGWKRTERTVIATFEVINDRTAAEGICPTDLLVDRNDLPELQDDEFYFEDLKGLEIITLEGNPIGHATAVGDYGAGAFLDLGNKTIPFNETSILSVDLDEGRIIVDPMFVL